MSEMNESIQKLIDAIKIEGPVPQYHRHIMRKHRSEWATLWKAIDEIVYLHDKKQNSADDITHLEQ